MQRPDISLPLPIAEDHGMADDEHRMREHPRERFSAPVRHLDLAEEYDDLLAEPTESIDNHRQISLLKGHGLSLILFYFEEGGELPDHQTDGEVSIHVMDGALDIETSEGTERVSDDELLVLKPGVEHSVEAVEPTKMLLTVGLVEGPSEG